MAMFESSGDVYRWVMTAGDRRYFRTAEGAADAVERLYAEEP